MPPNSHRSSRRHKSDRPKALTVRLNFARGPMAERRGQKFCRVTLGTRQHDTPKRSTKEGGKDIVEWNCILVYPYTTEKWLKIEMRDDSAFDRLACTIFDLHKLKEAEGRQFKGELELDDGTCVDADIAFYPRPSGSNSSTASAGTKQQTSTIAQSPPASLLTTVAKPQRIDEDEEAKVENLVNQTIQFFGAHAADGDHDDENAFHDVDPVMITIGNPNGPIYEKVEANPDKPLFPKKGPHRLGIDTMWVKMAGGTVAFEGEKVDDKTNPLSAPSLWNDLATPVAKLNKLKSTPLSARASDASTPVVTTSNQQPSHTPQSAPPAYGYPMQYYSPMYPVPHPYPMMPMPPGTQMGSNTSTNPSSSAASHDSMASVPSPNYQYPPPPYPMYGYPPGYMMAGPPPPHPYGTPSFDPRLMPQVHPSSMRMDQQHPPMPQHSDSFDPNNKHTTHNLPVWHGHNPSMMNQVQRRGSDSDSDEDVRRINTFDVPKTSNPAR